MGQQEGPLVSVHDVLAFLSDFDSLSDPPCCPIRFLADNWWIMEAVSVCCLNINMSDIYHCDFSKCLCRVFVIVSLLSLQPAHSHLSKDTLKLFFSRTHFLSFSCILIVYRVLEAFSLNATLIFTFNNNHYYYYNIISTSGSVNEYQLQLGRRRPVWFIPLADECRVCR